MACSPREGIQGDRVYAVTVMNPGIVGGTETIIAVPALPVTAATGGTPTVGILQCKRIQLAEYCNLFGRSRASANWITL